MLNLSSSPILTNVIFNGNSANDTYGGGMHNIYGSPSLINVAFSNNSANAEGGGIYNNSSAPTLTNVTFSGNDADYGGGISNYSTCNPTLTNVLFSSNFASNGGGMYNGNDSSATLTNVTFNGNSASYDGGGIYNIHNNLVLTNVILWGDSAPNGAEIYNNGLNYITLMIAFSDLQNCGGSGSWNSACGIDNGGNLDTNPLFMNAPGNLHLQSSSPLIDAGDTTAVPNDVTTDLDGNSRFSDTAVDMGAYEHQGATGIRLVVSIGGNGLGNITSVPAGISCPGDCSYVYPENTGVTLTATAGAFTSFDGWQVCDNPSGNICTLTMSANQQATATLTRNGAGVLYVAPSAQGSSGCSNWANACSLQTALSGAINGDEIWVQAGVYKPTGNPADRNATFNLRDGVAIYGGFAGIESYRSQRDWRVHPTILSGDIDQNDANADGNFIAESTTDLQGDNSFRVVSNDGLGASAVLDGFVITAGQASAYDSSSSGGGGMYNSTSNPSLANIIFSGNSTLYGGGGMYNNFSSPSLTNITFSGNMANSGGGIYNYDSNPTLTYITFSNNTANSGGGGIYNYGSNPTLTHVIFNNNSANDGGGMHDSYSRPLLTYVTFTANSATNYGGGMYHGYSTSSPTLTNVTFNINHADYGGGIYNASASKSPILANVTFSGNSARIYGGGLYNQSASPTLINVILWGDSASSGAEIYNNSSNTAAVTYSNVQGGYPGTGNINVDPLFVDSAVGNLRLQSTSPVIDAGNNAAVPSGIVTDLDNNPRFVDIFAIPNTGNVTVDMGAYEAQWPFKIILPLVVRGMP